MRCWSAQVSKREAVLLEKDSATAAPENVVPCGTSLPRCRTVAKAASLSLRVERGLGCRCPAIK